jgi:aminomethyltransferase
MENSAAGALLQTPIHGWHKSKNAKLADFGGWEMPIEYGDYLNKAGEKGGVLAEHNCVREKVGLFDVSHLGKIEVIGKGALDFLNQILTNDLAKILDGQAQYNMICNDAGGVIDDLIVYRRNANDCLLIPNAANCQEVYETLVSKNKSDISITNAHTKYAVIALQGPLTNEVLADLGISLDLEYMSFTTIKNPNNLDLGDVVVCRNG